MQRRIIFILVVLSGIFFLPSTLYAQDATLDVAIEIDLGDVQASSGSVVSYRDGVYMLSAIEYDENIAGIISSSPGLYLDDTGLDSAYIMTSGQIAVRVSNANGEIRKGDFLTSSNNPGIAQKATQTGQVLGVALEDFTGQTEGTVLTHVDIRSQIISQDIDPNVRVNLLEALRLGLESPFLTPVASLRYILAVLLVIAAFIIGFASFGRISGSGIEALGRNPLAKRAIQLTIVFNFALTAFIMFIGLALAYLVLIL